MPPTTGALRPTSSPTAQDAPRWPLLTVVCALLPLAILGTGVVSASATLLLFEHAKVPVDVRPFGLGMVEVVSLAGTLLAIFSLEQALRRRGMVAVVGAGSVAVIGGAQAYGWVGALANLFLIYLVHLASEAWLELRARTTGATATSTTTDEPVLEAPAVDPADGDKLEGDQLETEETIEDDDQRSTTVDEPVAATLGELEGPVTLVEYLRELPALPAERPLLDALNDRVSEEHRTTRHRVKVALREARTGLTAVSA